MGSTVVTFSVSGKVYTAARDTLQACPALYRMLVSDEMSVLARDEAGRPFLDADPQLFRAILFFLRRGKLPASMSANELRDLRCEADFFSLSECVAAIDEALSHTPLRINASGTIHMTSRDTILKGSPRLQRMLLPEGVSVQMDEQGVPFVDASAAAVHGVLQYLRLGWIPCRPVVIACDAVPGPDPILAEILQLAEKWKMGTLVARAQEQIDVFFLGAALANLPDTSQSFCPRIARSGWCKMFGLEVPKQKEVHASRREVYPGFFGGVGDSTVFTDNGTSTE